ncbi:MAG: hypothetical protein WCW52_05170 [Elusimicrobiales bacterium]
MKKAIFSMITFLCAVSSGFAGEFNPDPVNVSDLLNSRNAAIFVPVPARPDANTISRSKPSMDMSLKIPFSELNKRMAGLSDTMKVIDQAKPVLSRQGDHIVFTNVSIAFRGMEIEPTVQILPVFYGPNHLLIRFPRVDTELSFGPKGMNDIGKNDIMASLANSLMASLRETMDEAFAANKVDLRAEDVISFTYDRISWTLRVTITPDFIAPLLPGLTGKVSLTAFGFDDNGLVLSVRSGSGIEMGRMPGYNFAISDGMMTNFLRKYAEGGEYDLAPKDYRGGVEFLSNGRVVVSFKDTMRNSKYLKLEVYASIEFTPALTAPNTIAIRFEKVTVNKAYGFGIPSKLNEVLQNKVLALMVDTVMAKKGLTQAMSAKKLDGNTVELKLTNSAFLPSFVRGVTINKLRVGQGYMCLGFEF